ncbi:Cardiolipin synthase B [Methylobacterium organophilum]|uniref:Phospholipase D n=2 Tax=Methylobacterium organophilum TaxID=410 RepID=A0ABQ4T7L7_METOR|nr:Cardiolipin synthase B [Methylobacterium organophilum]
MRMERDLFAEGPAGPSGILRPGETCWRMARAGRVALLHDGAAYFRAARAAMLRARASITLIGWSLDPRVRLTPDAAGAAGQETLAAFLQGLKAARPELAIRLLIWRMPWAFSLGNEMKPDRIRALLGPGIDYRPDASLPFGACQHQKILLIDDRLAFCGGSDFEANRWDTPAHRDRDARRRLPSGEGYPPRHDVMMAVDGPAARLLAALARQRWQEGTGEVLAPAAPPPGPEDDPWPEGLAPALEDVAVAVARTVPARGGGPALLESAALYQAAIAAARRVIYLENQYFTAPAIGAALAARLAEPDGPEVVVVVSEHSPNAFDRLTMDSARRGLILRLRRADRFDRLRIVSPHTARSRPILMHSKVAIFDDRILRVGSTNLNNRSLGYDTECDLALEIPEGAARITQVLHGLLAHHAGLEREVFSAAVAARGSLRQVLDDRLAAAPGRLCRVVPSRRGPLARFVEGWHLGDPVGAADAWRPWRRPQALRRAPD